MAERRILTRGECPDKGSSPIMPILVSWAQQPVSWTREAGICGLGSGVSACLRLPMGERKPRRACRGSDTKIIV